MFSRVFFRVLASLVFVALLVGAVGLIGWTAYNAGLAQGAAQSGVQVAPGAAGPAGGPAYVVPYAFPPFGYGLGILGCFAPLLFLFAIFALFRLVFWGGPWGYRRWGWGMHGPHGRGWFRDFGPDDVPERWREKVAEWHRHLHEQAGPEASDEPKL